MLKKFLLPISVILLLIAALVASVLPWIIEKNMVNAAIEDAEHTVGEFKTLRGYYTKNVIAKAKAFGMEPHTDHRGASSRIPLPATMIYELSDELAASGTEIKLYSKYPFPNRTNRVLDDFEQRAWDALSSQPERIFTEQTKRDDKPYLRIAVADTMQEQGCVNCHNSHPQTPKNDWKLGDVRGVLEVTKPLEKIYTLSSQTRTYIIFGTLLILLLITGVVAMLFHHVVLKRTHQLRQAFAELASGQGDLTAYLDTGDNDQIGHVAKNFNRFLENFRHIIERVIHTAENVDSSASQVQHASEAILSTIKEQERQTDLIASSVNSVCGSIQEIAQSAEEAAQNTRQTNSQLCHSTSQMESTVSRMIQLNENMTKTETVIADLRQQSDQIGSVLDVIKSIAEQTNLLALNAAIEAARAGEQGRGFAVVADEVRALAYRTQESTSEIQSTVEKLQFMAAQAVNHVQQSCQQSDETQKIIQEVSQHLEETMKVEKNVLQAVSSIATAMDEQNATSEKMDRNVVQLKNLSKQSLDEVHHIVEQFGEVRSQSQQLTNELSTFKL